MIRAGAPVRPGVRVLYPHAMRAREINRAAWAAKIAALLAEHTRGKKATFARLVEVDPRTITRWLDATVDVSEESVRHVARALGIAPRDLLVEVGYYRAEEVGADVERPASPDDPVLQQILAAEVPARTKYRMIQRLEELRARQREVEAEEVRFWIEQAKGA